MKRETERQRDNSPEGQRFLSDFVESGKQSAVGIILGDDGPDEGIEKEK